MCLYPLFSFMRPSPPQFYTLSLHDALPICFYTYLTGGSVVEVLGIDYGSYTYIVSRVVTNLTVFRFPREALGGFRTDFRDRKSTRLNSSHTVISYAVFCLKKKKKNRQSTTP